MEVITLYQAGGMTVGLSGSAAFAEEAGVKDHGATFSGIALEYNFRQADDMLN